MDRDSNEVDTPDTAATEAMEVDDAPPAPTADYILEHNALVLAIKNGRGHEACWRDLYRDFPTKAELDLEELLAKSWSKLAYLERVLAVAGNAGAMGVKLLEHELERRERTGMVSADHIRLIAASSIKIKRDLLELILLRLENDVVVAVECQTLIQSLIAGDEVGGADDGADDDGADGADGADADDEADA